MNNATRAAAVVFIALAAVAAAMAVYAYIDVVVPARALEHYATAPIGLDDSATTALTPRASASAEKSSAPTAPPPHAYARQEDDEEPIDPEEWNPEEATDPYGVEIWALGCSAIMAKYHSLDPYRFGMMDVNSSNAARARSLLAESWAIDDREGLLETLNGLATEGYSASFAEDYLYCSSLSEEEYEELLAASDETGQLMWPLTKSLGDRWGDQQILAWDGFSMFTLAGWGYVAGYLELQEAYDLLVPAIDTLRGAFSSWEEATENYLDGYAWWSCSDLTDPNSSYWAHYDIYRQLRSDPAAQSLFDASVWN